MAKIVILMGRANSGKTQTIDEFANILSLKNNDRKYPNFVKLYGLSQEIGSGKEIEVFAERSSPQEKYKNLKKILTYIEGWIEFLKDKKDAIAIIPFTMMCDEMMEEIIMQPLGLLKDIKPKIVHLDRPYKYDVRNKGFAEKIFNKIKIDKVIQSNDDAPRQAEELIDYLGLKHCV